MKVNKTAEPVEEVIEAVYKHLRKVYPDGQVDIHLPEEVILFKRTPF